MGLNEPLICKGCGGAIDRITFKCKYCGTAYDLIPKYKLELFSNPVEHIAAEFSIDEYMIQKLGPTEASRIAIEELSKELSKSLPLFMRVSTITDYKYGTVKYRGDIHIVRPKQISGR